MQNSPPIAVGQVMVSASANFADNNQPIRSGLVWRIPRIAATPCSRVCSRGRQARPPISPLSSRQLHHPRGIWIRRRTSKRISVQSGNLSERLTISAGALRLKGAVGDSPIPGQRLSFSVYVALPQNSEGRLVLANAKANDLIRLPEGTYHVVSTYGDANAIMRADLKVESGKVTEATLNHRAATVTLKLVERPAARRSPAPPSAF